jgi:hypothetical protein
VSSKAIFGSAIACILLGLYVYLVWSAASVVGCSPEPGCKVAFTDSMASAMSSIGGLIAALVIAELAITKPGEAPAARILASGASPAATKALGAVTAVYIVVWILCGLRALLIGWHHPRDVEALTSLGESWLGVAVAAGYAYFGVNPKA